LRHALDLTPATVDITQDITLIFFEGHFHLTIGSSRIDALLHGFLHTEATCILNAYFPKSRLRVDPR
jgi:hypothetical protein